MTIRRKVISLEEPCLDFGGVSAMQNATRYWFPAKRYGWGWGFPITWEGWLTLAVFFGLAAAGIFMFPPKEALAAYLFYLTVLSALLVAIGWFKGEPPRWRWGND
jgi:hypothetical protein